MTPAARSLAVERARDELRAAHALLERPDLAAAAVVHLERAGRIVTELGASATGGTDRARAHALARALAGLEPSPARLRRIRRWIARAAVTVALLATIFIVARPTAGGDRASGPWSAQYFRNRHFHGEPTLTRDRDVNFDWGDGVPRFGFSYDHFAVRWHTCLVLPAPTTITLAATSHDASRILIDDALVVDNWGDHELRTVRKTVELGAGVHLVELRYTSHLGPSGVALHAAIDGGPLAPLPAELLRLPSSRLRCD